MTREEAIQTINDNYPSSSKGEYEDLRNALNVAIRSLQAWDKVIDDLCEQDMKNRYELHMDDYNVGIDQAIDIINKHLKEVDG